MPITLNRATPSTTIASSPHNTDQSALETIINNRRPVLYLPVLGALEADTDVIPSIKMTYSLTINNVDLLVKVAPTGANIIVDILKNGSTIFSTKPQIVAGETSGGTGAVLSVTSVVSGDIITANIDQIGSTLPGEDLTISLVFKE